MPTFHGLADPVSFLPQYLDHLGDSLRHQHPMHNKIWSDEAVSLTIQIKHTINTPLINQIMGKGVVVCLQALPPICQLADGSQWFCR